MGKESQGRGRGRSRYGGRGKGRSNANPNKSDNKKPEMKFYPHAVGAQSQSVTFDTVCCTNVMGRVVIERILWDVL